MSRLDPVHVKIMREFAKKKSDASFKKFVGIRSQVVKILQEEMKIWTPKEKHAEFSMEIEKKFTKENFPTKGIQFIEKYLVHDKYSLFNYWV